MGISLKGIGKALGKVGNAINPAAAAGRALVTGKGVKGAASTFIDSSKTGAKGAAALLPIALSGGAGAGALGSLAGGAGAAAPAAAGAAGGAGGLFGTLTKIGRGVLDNSDLLLGAGSLISGLDQQRKGDRYDAKALAEAEALDRLYAPLRTQAVGDLMAPPSINLRSRLPQSSNPFARRS
jgi:hypothetical protein